jgi:outer membrane receptor protein involved in Fe transport
LDLQLRHGELRFHQQVLHDDSVTTGSSESTGRGRFDRGLSAGLRRLPNTRTIMDHPFAPQRMLLLVAAFAMPLAAAQEAPPPPTEPPAGAAAPEGAVEEVVDIEIAGEIVVVGRRDRNIQQATTQVISVLSAEDIARTGDGDVAGALSRVTGLSVSGSGFVYVRGLGDRYSQAFLNGSPLPSPEPLRRAVPLDIFPTDIIASSLVQKSYSANLTGEFGGGLINLTTLAVPKEPFLKVGLGIGGDSETTGQIGYQHYGSKYDPTGVDSGLRDTPPALGAFFASGERLSSGKVDAGAIAAQFVNTRNGLVQLIDKMPANLSGSVTGGTSKAFDDGDLGFIATAGYSNSWKTRDIIEQNPASADLSRVDKDYRKVVSENRIVVNGLAGLAYEYGEGNRIRWTNLIVRDTLKRTSLAEGKQNNQRPTFDFREQETGWYERQLWSTQLTGGFNLDPVKIDARVAFANSSREAPFEMAFGYSRSNIAASPYGAYFINRLDNGQTGFARAAFSELDEDLFSYGVDLTWEVNPTTFVSGGYDYSKTERESKRREFLVLAPSSFPSGVAMFRPDYLLGKAVIEYYDIGMVESTETDPAFAAEMQTNAAYLQLQAEIADGLELSAGARYEKAEQIVKPLQVFSTASSSTAGTNLENDYVLPAVTLTYKFADSMQLRLNGSKTIARPQFRELMFQAYFDPESNRAYRGNPLLVDSEFTNAELRYEWYFAPEQRLAVAGFYKQIDKPIEAFTGFNDNSPVTSFANAPEATLYGVELESQKYFDMDLVFDNAFFASRRGVLIANYTWSDSEIKVGAGDTTEVFGTASQPASNFFVDGTQLTGQSNHLVNLQIGLEDRESLSQQTLLVSYAADRVFSRGAAGLPDVIESPGINVDFVVRQGFTLFDRDIEFKFEARNLLRTGYEEFQQRGGNKVFFNRYDRGVSYSASISASF